MKAELLYAGGRTDRQTDMTKLIVAFRNFANAHDNESVLRTLYVSVCSVFMSENNEQLSMNLVFGVCTIVVERRSISCPYNVRLPAHITFDFLPI
jgi:hypothetical protein